MLKKRLFKIRNKLDRLDNELLKLIKKRTLLVDQVLKNKKYKKEIIDNQRIKKILRNISKKSKKNNIDIILTNKIWKSMIRAYIDYEFRMFKK